MSNSESEDRENILKWLIRYILMPLTLAVIGGWIALAVVDRQAERENQPVEHTHEAFADSIFATMTAVAPQSTPVIEPTPTEKVDSEEKEINDTPTPDVVVPPAQPQPVCGQVPPGWQLYTVQPGNTLFSLARQTGTSVNTIRDVNCLFGQLQAFDLIWLPFVPVIDKPIEEATAVIPEPILLPDLINDTTDWPSMWADCSGGCSLNVLFAIGNVGTAESGGFTTQFSIDGIPIGEFRIEQILAPGELAVNQATFGIPDSCVHTSTPCQVCITVDSQNELLEENETNNGYCGSIQ